MRAGPAPTRTTRPHRAGRPRPAGRRRGGDPLTAIEPIPDLDDWTASPWSSAGWSTATRSAGRGFNPSDGLHHPPLGIGPGALVGLGLATNAHDATAIAVPSSRERHDRWRARLDTLVDRIVARLDATSLAGASSSGLGGPWSPTQGWPRRGSTVERIVRVPLAHVLDCTSQGGSFGGLRLGPISWTLPGIDGRRVSTGRLRIPRSVRPVAVELRLSPYSGTASFAELVLVGRGRFPRRYWACGHDALTAFVHAAGG